jgi:oligopeptide transport system substrate-binding protein
MIGKPARIPRGGIAHPETDNKAAFRPRQPRVAPGRVPETARAFGFPAAVALAPALAEWQELGGRIIERDPSLGFMGNRSSYGEAPARRTVKPGRARDRLIALAALAALPAVAAAAPAADSVLRRPMLEISDILDPQKTASASSIAIDRDMFTGLLALDNHRRLVPGVAESWDISIDGKVWTFHLRPGVKWSDGEPLTAEDFVYSFRRLVDPKTGAYDASDLDQVENALAIRSGKEPDLAKLGVVAVDPSTVRITLVEPRAAFRNLLVHPQLFPLHRASVEKWGAEWTRPEHIVSNGPYVMKGWVPKGDVALVRNPNFYDSGAVHIGEVRWVDVYDHAAAIKKFRAGELDFVDIGVEDLDWFRQNVPDQLHSALTDEIYFLFFNMAKGPLARDARVREAINLAVDRDFLVTRVDPHGEKPAYGLESALVSNYTPQSMPFRDKPMPERLERARQLIREAGYGPDKPLKLTVIYASPEPSGKLLRAVGDMVRPLGIELAFEQVAWQELGNRKNRREFEIGWMAEVSEYDDYESLLLNFWSGSNYFNFTGYANPKYDEVFRHVLTEMDGAMRRAYAEEAERVMLADYPFAPIYFNVRNRVVAPRLRNLPDEVRYPQSRYLVLKDPA